MKDEIMINADLRGIKQILGWHGKRYTPKQDGLTAIPFSLAKCLGLAEPPDPEPLLISDNRIIPTVVPGTTFVLSSFYNACWIVFTANTLVTVTVPLGLIKGFNCTIIQGSDGQVRFVGPVTLLRDPDQAGHDRTKGQNSRVILLWREPDVFDFMGSTAL